jgi:hypothetical protein
VPVKAFPVADMRTMQALGDQHFHGLTRHLFLGIAELAFCELIEIDNLTRFIRHHHPYGGEVEQSLELVGAVI